MRVRLDEQGNLQGEGSIRSRAIVCLVYRHTWLIGTLVSAAIVVILLLVGERDPSMVAFTFGFFVLWLLLVAPKFRMRRTAVVKAIRAIHAEDPRSSEDDRELS